MNSAEKTELYLRLDESAQSLGRWLFQAGSEKVVFAESCTAGLVAASLAAVPGISQHFCGSMVTYREASKISWLAVNAQLLEERSAVSQPVTDAMALGVLRSTPEATWSAAVTGHLGPGAPPALDGQIFISIARRQATGLPAHLDAQVTIRLCNSSRRERQAEAAANVLELLRQVMQGRS